MAKNILLTRRWPASVENEMQTLGSVQLNQADAPMAREALVEALATADVVCPTVTDQFDAEMLLGANVRTRLLANFGVGFNHIDIEAAVKAGIQVSNTPGVLTDATAEIALALLLASARRITEGERHVRADAWIGWRPTHMLSTQVTGKTIGIVGMGRIGTAFARKVHHGLGMRVLYCNRSPVPESVAIELSAVRVTLEELLERSDFVSLHCPATPETRHLIDADALDQMRPHAHLINTARGDVVDEVALVKALQSGAIGGAGLDVYEAEPALAAGLTSLENVVLLPHMGSGTVETREAMGQCALNNVRAFLGNEVLPDRVC
jgi:glyoxylate reductase